MAGASLRRLSYFVAVARERNFTRAAERLRIAQPALSRQVRLLERELGVDLLRRTTHQVELTEAGEFLLARAPELLASADDLWRRTRAFGSGERGRVVLAYGASAAYETAPELVRRLAEHHPHIELATELRGSGPILAALRDGTVDLGLVRCPPDAPDLDGRTVRAERQGVLLQCGHRLADRETVALGELASETLLLHPRDANPGHYDAVLALCRDAGVEPYVKERALSFDLAQTPVLLGRAVAVVGESTRVGLPEQLRWIPLVPRADLPVVLLARLGDRSPAVERLLESAASIAASLGWTGPDVRALKQCRTGLSQTGPACLASSPTPTNGGDMPLVTDNSKAVVREYVTAVLSGDREAVRSLFAEDATWTLQAGDLPISGTYEGRDAIFDEFLTEALGHYEPGSIDLEITGMTAEDDRVVLQWTSRARTTSGRPYENGCIGVFRIRDGRILAVREYMDTLYAHDTAFG